MKPTDPRVPLLSRLRNWLSMAGLVTMGASFFANLLLFLVDSFGRASNPYVGVLTYLVAPAFTVLGLVMVFVGMWLHRKDMTLAGKPMSLVIDLSRAKDRKILAYFATGSVLFLMVTAIGSYYSYQFTESVEFCGKACHTVMEPEQVTYQHSPHAKVSCVECHIGPGAEWFVKAKLSGLYQVYANAFNKYPRPVPTPIKNLRPAQDTCEHCHWPEKFSGNLVRNYNHFLSDATNTEYSLSVLLKVGGANPGRGPVSGIHWHISKDHKVEYLATDEKRLQIPWVRLTEKDGQVTEFRAPSFTNAVNPAEVRVMDCIDCHNRPAHIYKKPNDAVDLALALGTIDRGLLSVRSNATYLLTQTYTNVAEAMSAIATGMAERYPGDARVQPAVAALQGIYRNNFFPEMKANWLAYPEHIGHKDWPGCARCHDDNHPSTDGQKNIGFKDCHTCHEILSQGAGPDLMNLTPGGQEFNHPIEPYDPEFKCHDCHTGGP